MTVQFYDALWGKTALTWSAAKRLRERRILALIKRYTSHLSTGSESYILDVGCGRGTLLSKMSRNTTCHLSGIDISAKAIGLNRRALPHIHFLVRNVEDGNWTNGIPLQDLVIAQEVIEHLRRERQAPFLRELGTLIRPGGHAVITSPDWQAIQSMRKKGETDEAFALRFEGQPTANLLDSDELENLVVGAGLEVVWSKTIAPHLRERRITQALGYFLGLLPMWVEDFALEKLRLPGRYRVILAKRQA